MSDKFICIKFKTQTGSVQEIRVAEIIEIDGQPYVPQDWKLATAEALADHGERIAALEERLNG